MVDQSIDSLLDCPLRIGRGRGGWRGGASVPTPLAFQVPRGGASPPVPDRVGACSQAAYAPTRSGLPSSSRLNPWPRFLMESSHGPAPGPWPRAARTSPGADREGTGALADPAGRDNNDRYFQGSGMNGSGERKPGPGLRRSSPGAAAHPGADHGSAGAGRREKPFERIGKTRLMAFNTGE
jgi:hypothetical protein